MHLKIELSEKQTLFQRSLDTFDVTGFGGAKGGSKSHSARIFPLLRSLSTPGHVGALFRHTYPELEDNHIGPLFRQYPELRAYYNSQQHMLRFPHLESEFKFRYAKNMKEVEDHAGREYHTLVIEEGGNWTYQMAMALIRNSNRCSVPGIRPSAAICFNWGGVGHAWLKRIFYSKLLRPNEAHLTWNFILARFQDNPFIDQKSYEARLNSEPNEALRRAHRDGDANIVAGQYFDLNPDIHYVKNFEVPEHWQRFAAYDYGFGHPCALGWFAVDGDGCVYLYRTIVQAGMTLEQLAAEFWKHPDSKKINVIWAGHDCWAKKTAAFGKKLVQPSVAEDLALNHKMFLKPANIDRVQGARMLRDYLHPFTDAQKQVSSNLKFFQSCQIAFDCIGRMLHDPNNVEDVLKVDSTDGDPESGDDAYDMIRMGIMSRPPITKPLTKPQRDGYNRSRRPAESSWMTV